MKKSIRVGVAVSTIGSVAPAFAADGYFHRDGDRIDHRLDRRDWRRHHRFGN